MAHVKLGTDDLILAYRNVHEDNYYKVFTLVCRADIHKPNSWNLIPSIDIALVDNKWEECAMYLQAIKDVQFIQEYKYPKIKEVKAMLEPEIDKFHQTINALYQKTKTK